MTSPITHENIIEVLAPFVALIEAIECTTDHEITDDTEWDINAPAEFTIVSIGNLRAARDLYQRLQAEKEGGDERLKDGLADLSSRFTIGNEKGFISLDALAAEFNRRQTLASNLYDLLTAPLNQEGGDAAAPGPTPADRPHVATPASGADSSGRARELIRKYQTLLSLLTVRQVIRAGDDAIEATGLNPWAINEGLAAGDETISTWWVESDLNDLLATGRRSGIEEAAKVADGFTCGSCGMDGKASASIRALLTNPEKTI